MVRYFRMKRVFTGILIGFFSRILYQQVENAVNLSSNTSSLFLKQNCFCHIDNLCPVCKPTKIQITDLSQSKSYKPKDRHEVTRWILLDKKNTYDIINEEPKLHTKGVYREELIEAIDVGMDYLNANQMMGQSWYLVHLHNSYLKIDSIRGTNIILDIVVKSATRNYSHVNNEQLFRIELVHPLYKVENSKLITNKKQAKSKIKVIVPAPLDMSHINIMIDNFATIDDDNVELVIIVFDDNDDVKTQTMMNAINKKISRLSTSHIRILQEKGTFSYATGLQNAVSETNSNDIVMVLEEDVFITKGILEHCRSICDEQKRVYFPVPFAQFDANVVEKGMPPGKSQNVRKQSHNKFTGHWAYRMHNTFCGYKIDILRILSSIRPSVTEFNKYWAYQQFLEQDYQVMMAVEPHLFKPNQNNMCLNKKDRHAQCLKTKALHLGSKPTLGVLYIKEIMEKS